VRSSDRNLLGFQPAFLDVATMQIHASRDVVHKGPLIRGFERNGFFYTLATAARLAEDWPCAA
jgi:hypothetical protein